MTSTSPPARFDDDTLASLRARLTMLERNVLDGDARRAAVLVPLCHVGGRAGVLFTKRSEAVGTHKGQVSFPGGMVDDDDEGVIACALRELYEEVGVERERVEILGLFHDARSITGVNVTPVVGFLGDVDVGALTPSAAEIDGLFTIALRELVDPKLRYQQDFGARGRLQVFDAGPYPVWGLTSFILEGVLTELFGLALPDVEVRPFSRLP